jgi:hypothetical protein
MQIGVITNPNSRKNLRKANRAAVLQSIVGDFGEVRQTPDVDSIKPVLREFLRQKARFWVSDGGDGALHWMLREGLEVLEEEEFAGKGFSLPLAMPTNGGSIDFVAHNVGLRGNAETLLAALRRALEAGQRIEEAEVDSMLIEGVESTPEGDRSFRTLGFAVAAGGVGQRFFEKLFAAGEHNGSVMVSIVAKTVASWPIAMSPLRHLPGLPELLKTYACEMFKPTTCRITLDGKVLPYEDATGIHIASMSIDLAGLMRFFGLADQPGILHAIVGRPSPACIIANLPRMYFGRQMKGEELYDGPCKELTLEATGEELLGPVIDGEFYQNVRRIAFKVGPRVRIPKVVGPLRN